MKLIIQSRKAIGPIHLGMTRVAVRAALTAAGCPLKRAKDTLDYFFHSSIQVEYQPDETASFIGISSHEDIELIFEGRDLFDTPAEEAFRHIASFERNKNHVFDDSGYLFPDQIITLYEADSQYDRKGNEARVMWGQIGIGDERYLAAIRNREGN